MLTAEDIQTHDNVLENWIYHNGFIKSKIFAMEQELTDFIRDVLSVVIPTTDHSEVSIYFFENYDSDMSKEFIPMYGLDGSYLSIGLSSSFLSEMTVDITRIKKPDYKEELAKELSEYKIFCYISI